MSYGEVYIAERTMHQRLDERRRQIDARRRRRQVLPGLQKRDRFYGDALAWLGNRLVIWGSRLQERYSTASLPSVPRPAKRLTG